MAGNVAQQIKNLSDEIARLDKGLENTKALADKIFENSSNIGDALQKSFRKGDDAAKETTAVLKELLKTITDNFGNGKELKLAIGIEKSKLRHAIAETEKDLRGIDKKINAGEWSSTKKTIDAYKQQLAQLTDFERTFADINKVINGDNGKQQSQISKQRVKDEKDVQKIQEQTTAALQKRIELEERLKTLKPNAKAWRETKAEIETVNKEVQNYLARMGSLGTAGARQLKAYEKAGLITNADKTQLALERQQIDLLRQRMQAEEQLNRLLLQRNNATLAGKTVSPKVADSISRLQERIDTIDKQRIGSYQNFTQVSLQRIEGMWQNHETALTNIKTQGEQARERIVSRENAAIDAIIKQRTGVNEQEERKRLEIERAWNQLETSNTQQREKEKSTIEKAAAVERTSAAEQELKKRQQINKAWDDLERKQRVGAGDPLGDLAARRGLTGNLAALQDTSAIVSRNKEIADSNKIQADAQKQIVDILKQQLAIQNQIDKLKQAPQQTQAVQQQIQNLTQQYNQLGSSIRAIANGNQDIINQAQVQVAVQKQHQENIKNTTSALNDSKNQEKAYNDGIKQMQKDEDNARKAIISLMQQQLNIQGQLNRLQNAPATQATQGQIQNLTSQYQALGQQIQTVANGNQQLVQSAQQYVSAQAQAQQNAQQTTNAINAARQQAQQQAQQARQQAQAQAQAAKQRAAIERKADSESIANQRRQIQIKAQLSAIDKARNSDRDISSKRAKAQIAEENAEYKRLSAELTRLIARQKELNAVSQGSGSRARGRLQTYEITASEQALRRYEEAWRRVNREQKQSDDNMRKMLSTVTRLASAFGVAFSVQGLVQFGKKLVETRGEFELQQVALRSILQNKQLADEIWDKTMQAALQSPFTAMQLTKYTKQLAAYRIETDKLFDTTKRLADVSAGLGVDMQRLILAYGQVKSANYLRASEIRQFTEAGVNVLGELSDYFARTRGEIVSTAQVMDMVQKRMVKFEDVEAIFKHMTNEGGIFYNMQYVQSQTVKGQINKLHDAYDQMLNSIGQGNQGVLKNMVSIANNLVRNWREVAGTIKGIAWAFVFVQLGKVALGIHRIGTEAITSGSKVSWLARQLGKLREKSKGYEFGKVFSKANVVLAAGAAVAFVTGKFFQHLNAVRQINEKYNELSLRAYETQENLSGIQKTLSQNNQNIERLNKVNKKSKEREEELANVRKHNAEIVNRLKRDYPELADGMNIQKNGVVTLTSAISDYNEQLEYTILLNQLAKGNAWNDDFQTNVTEMTQSLQSAEQTLASYQALAKSIKLQMEHMDFGFRQKNQAEGLKKLLEGIIGLDKGDYEGLNKLLKDNPLRGYNYLTQTRTWRAAFQPIWLDEHNIKATKKQLERSESVLYDLLKNSVRRDKEYMTEISKEWGGDIDKFIHNNAERIQKNVDDGKKDTFKAIREYGLQMGFAFKGAQDIFNQTLNSGNTSLFGGLGFRFFEYPGAGETGTDTETAEEKQSKIDAAWRRRINLLEEMKKRYDELSKSAYGYAKSNTTVRTEFEKSWGKIFGSVLSMNAVQFTSAAEMEAAFETILAKAGAASDAVKEEIQKKADSYGARIPIDVQVRIREDFGRQMEEAFGNYELTLELQKLNLPKGLAADMWGIEEVDLSQLRGRLDELFQGLKDANGEVAADSLKAYESYLKKIDDLEQKQQRERLKDYAKYIEAQYSDRVKLEMDYVRKVAKLEAETAISPEQRAAIRAGIDKEYNEAVKKQDWEDFKGSEFYVQMMEDLEKQGTASLEVMREKLEEMRKNAENLTPRALKEVVNSLEKIDEIERGRTAPLQRLKKALDDLGDTNMSEVYKSLAANQKQLAVQEEQKRQLEEMIMLENERNRLKDKGINLDEITSDAARAQLSAAEDLLRLTNIRYNEFKSDGSKESNQQLQGLLEQVNQQKAIVELWQKIVQMFARNQTIEDIGKDNPYIGMSISDLNNTKEALEEQIKNTNNNISAQRELVRIAKALQQAWYDTFESIKDYAQRIGGIFDGVTETIDYFADSTNSLAAEWREFGNAAVSALSDLVSGIQAYKDAKDKAEKGDAAAGLMSGNMLKLALIILGVIIKIIQAVAKFQDSAIDKEIERSRQRVDELSRAYERLERSIERTFKTADYMANYNEQMQNLREQLAAAEAQISAASQYKDEDKKRDALNSARDAKDQVLDMMDETEQRQLETFGGIGKDNYRSWAEGFVDAWKDAFLETGDGLDALQDHFDEFLQEWFVKQATMRIAGKALEGVMGDIDKVVSDNGVVDWAELQRIKDQMDLILPDLNDKLTAFAGMWDFGGEGGLSGLAAGIQGMTEEQANILEAYWNSVRMYNASIDMNVARLVTIVDERLGVQVGNAVASNIAPVMAMATAMSENAPSTNPMLQQMSLIAANTQATHQLLQTVVKSGHPQGGYGIKVFND